MVKLWLVMNLTNWYVNNRRQDREKNSLPSFDSCPFLWTAHRFLPIEQNRVTPDDTVWSFNRFPSSWFYQRIYALETDSIIYSKIPFCRCDCYGQLVNQAKVCCHENRTVWLSRTGYEHRKKRFRYRNIRCRFW